MKQKLIFICIAATLFLAACGDKQSASGEKKAETDDTTGLTLLKQSEDGVFYFNLDNASCLKSSGISGGFQEGVAEKYHVAVTSVKYLRTQIEGKDCSVIVDTPVGPKQCFVGSVIKIKSGKFLFHTYAKGTDGSETLIRGACL